MVKRLNTWIGKANIKLINMIVFLTHAPLHKLHLVPLRGGLVFVQPHSVRRWIDSSRHSSCWTGIGDYMSPPTTTACHSSTTATHDDQAYGDGYDNADDEADNGYTHSKTNIDGYC